MVEVLAKVAVIGGSGFYEFPDLDNARSVDIKTPYEAVVKISVGKVGNKPVAFMPRHGPDHRIPPHLINYRANIWALKSLGVDFIFALNAVGGIASEMGPGALVVPDQVIDYTFARQHTYAYLC